MSEQSAQSGGVITKARTWVEALDDLRPPELGPALRWLSAPALVGFAFLVQREILDEPSVAPFVFFYFAVAVTGWVGGRAPSLLAVVLCALLANYFFLDPVGSWETTPAGLRAMVVFLAGATPVGLLCGTLRTATLRAQRATEVLARQADLLHLSHDAIFVWRFGDGIESWNQGAEELYGYAAREALGRVSHDLLRTVFPESREAVERSLREQGRWQGRLRHQTRDGRVVCVAARLRLGRGADGVERVLESNRDITEQVRAEEEVQRLAADLAEQNAELRAGEERKDEFIAVLSHELRNPLAPVSNALHLLARVPPGSEQARRALGVIGRQIRHMTQLVGDLLDVSRISRGKIQISRAPLDLNGVVARCAEDNRNLFGTRHITFTAHLTPEPLQVDGDADRLYQVVGNLLHNAAKFTPQGGRVELSLDHEHGAAVLRVRDTGVGIRVDMLATIFRPFTQAAPALDRPAAGLGIGLALVKELVALHGGEVSAASEGPSRGAELTVRLPAEVAEVAPPPVVEPAPVSVGRRVLVIEDNLDAAESLRDALALDAHDVAVAHDGPEGVEKARRFAPEVVLCDIGLPGMDGYEVARALRADAATRGLTLVALTGYAQARDEQRAREAGFDRHLAKPPDLDELRRILNEPPASRAA